MHNELDNRVEPPGRKINATAAGHARTGSIPVMDRNGLVSHVSIPPEKREPLCAAVQSTTQENADQIAPFTVL